MISRIARYLLALVVSLVSAGLHALDIKVGVYPFAPFVEVNKDSTHSGMTLDMMALLNKQQNEFNFIPVSISPKRRYTSYKDGEFDIIFYESRKWGWQNIDILESDVYQTGGEVYVALKKPNRDQSFFDNFSGKRMVGLLGYHYGFANFNSDEDFLRENYNMVLTWDNAKGIELLLAQRGDIAVVTQAFLKRYLLRHPEHKDRFLVSEKMDQEYNHTALLRPRIALKLEELNQMIQELKKTEDWQQLLARYGVEAQR